MRFYKNMAERAAFAHAQHHREVLVRLNRIQENVNILLDIMKRDDEVTNGMKSSEKQS